MRTVKFVATLVLGYTIGEFFTQYRVIKTPDLTLGQFTKNYVAANKVGFKVAEGAGMNLASDEYDRDLGKLQFKQLLFPNS